MLLGKFGMLGAKRFQFCVGCGGGLLPADLLAALLKKSGVFGCLALGLAEPLLEPGDGGLMFLSERGALLRGRFDRLRLDLGGAELLMVVTQGALVLLESLLSAPQTAGFFVQAV